MNRPPNIVFLFPDQLRRDFLGCYGANFIDTPNIDWIADNGVRYDNAYSASPICVPARTGLLTGMNAVRNGVTDNLHALRSDYNDAGIRTWPQLLAEAGYYTSAVGKMHFYPWDARHGFQYRVVCEDKLWAYVRDDYYHYLEERGLRKLPWDEYGDYVANRGPAATDVPWEHSWDRFTGREARRFIERHGADGPFALMVGFPGPHDPYDPATDFPHKFDADDMPNPIPAAGDPAGLVAEHVTKRQKMGMDLADWSDDRKKDARAHYAGLVKQIDHEVGEIIDTLRAQGLLENTAIVFATDHGDHLGDHGLDGKATFYEAATHIPLLVRPPRGADATAVDDLVELRDVTATMLRLAGQDLPDHMDAQPLPGLGLTDLPPRQRIFGMLTKGWMAFDGRWKLAKYASTLDPMEYDTCMTSSRSSSGRALLFDLDNDPDELRDLAADPDCASIYRRLDDELTHELMESIALAMHDRLTAPYSLAQDEAFAREGWSWPFPADASTATIVGKDCY